MAVLTVIKDNGYSASLPDDTLKLTVDVYDLDSEDGTGRNQDGELFRDRIAILRKVNCEWGLLTPLEMATIQNAIEDVFFTLVYPDPKTGAGRSMTAYVSDRSAPMFLCGGSVSSGEALTGSWSGLSLSFVEK